MADKSIQMKIKNGAAWDNLHPVTKAELVDGLAELLEAKVDEVVGKGLSTEDYTSAEKTKLEGIAAGANNYSHPTGDGNLHVPATGTGNNGKFLKAGATAGSLSWQSLAAADIPQIALSKIADAGTAAAANTGTAAGNVPVIGADGRLNAGVLPAIAITDTFVADSQAEMLALTCEVGDVAVRRDQSRSYILKAEPATTLANWQELLTPTAAVSSVAGKTGAVTLTKDDVGLTNVTNESKATMFNNAALTGISTAPNQAAGNNSNRIANTAFVQQELASLAVGAKITVSATEPSNADFWYQEI